MYIKLGNTNIWYSKQVDDFFIVSEVINSNTSYEKPILVRSIDELDVWFGRNFSERDYLKELLETGITLFLYKPISIENYLSENYINFFEYSNSDYYTNIDEIKSPSEKIIYRVYNKFGKYIDNNFRYDKYIYIGESFIKLEELPQNLEDESSISLINRDTLRICYRGINSIITYSNPKFSNESYTPEYTEIIDKELLQNNLPSQDRINLGYETLAFDLDFTKVNFDKSSYIILSDKVGRKIIIVFGEKDNDFPSNKYYDSEVIIDILERDKYDILLDFFENLKSFGYNVIKYSDDNYSIYASFKLNCNYFYKLENLIISPNYQITQNILSKFTENNSRIEFYSKVIGFDDEKIKVKIDELDINLLIYRVTVSKYDYQEVFEGHVGKSRINKESILRLDSVINTNSKLITCKVIDNFINDSGSKELYVNSNTRSPRLLTGSWELSRSYIEEYNNDSYWRSFNSIMNEDLSGFIDYFLIPNINNYVNKLNINYNYFTEYLTLLESSSSLGYQILIQNSDYGDKFTYIETDSFPEDPKVDVVYIINSIYYMYVDNEWKEISDPIITNPYKNDFLFNYTEDKDNRLIYFFRSIKVYGNDRPGYYLFLKSLLENDSYSGRDTDILYNQPNKDFYKENNLTNLLSKYKSNYLNFNNLFYFYKDYQNGENYNTTLWMRFCLGKISRELEKNKWKFLAKKYTGDIIKNISSILNKIQNTFSIIRSINVTDYNFDFQNQKLNLSIYTKISDLVDNDINIDITINYNNKNLN